MGLLNRIFGNKEQYESIDFGVFNTDMHSHLLPGIDDGAKNIEESIELIREMYSMGYRKIITTPHVMSDYYRNTPEIIKSKLDIVREELKRQNINITFEASAEYNLDDGFEPIISNGQLIPFGNNYILFELPFMQEPRNLQEIIFKMQTSGFKPILAHPERYEFWHRNFEKYEELKSKGVLLQLNLLSLTGYYNPNVKKIAERLVDSNLIDFVGTDCHRIDHLKVIQSYSNSKYFSILAKCIELKNSSL